MSLRHRLLRLLWAGPVALGVCYFALWACAPVFSQPPPTPMPDARIHEVGLAAGSAYDPRVPDACVQGMLFTDNCSGPQLQAYYRAVAGKVELAGLLHGGNLSGVGAGALVRGWFIDRDFRLGLTGSGGFLWAGVGLPVAWKVGPKVWMYTEPTASVAMRGMGRVPLGVQVEAGQLGLGLEAGAMTADDPTQVVGYGALRLSWGF